MLAFFNPGLHPGHYDAPDIAAERTMRRAHMNDGGDFGKWTIDQNGLPAFKYDCREFEDPVASQATTWGRSITHYHLMGNACWFGIATNHGQFYCLDPRRGFTLIGGVPGSTLPNPSSLVTFTISCPDGTTTCDINTRENQPLSSRLFGAGYVEKHIDAGPVHVEIKLVFPAGDEPAVVVECKLENASDQPLSVRLRASWNLFHLPLSRSLIVSWNGRRKFQVGAALNGLLRFATRLQKVASMDTDGARRKHSRRIRFTFLEMQGSRVVAIPRHRDSNKHHPRKPSGINYHYRPIVIECIDEHPGPARVTLPRGETANDGARVDYIYDISLPAQAMATKRFVLACAGEEQADATVARLRTASQAGDLQAAAARWFKDRAVSLVVPGSAWLDRELAWHGTYLLSSMFVDDYHGLHRVPQGSVYLLGHGFDGSIRDFCLFCYPLTFMDPAHAREFLRFIYTCVDDDGKIAYALHGYGQKLVVPGIHANPSDQYFFVAWATAEYVYLTRDFHFLNEQITVKDDEGNGKTLRVKDLLARLIRYVLSPEIGIGAHGLIRVRDGDWNDGISLMAKNRKAFIKDGESTYNSAMLLLTFAKVLPLVEGFDPLLAKDMATALTRVGQAVGDAWNGKWYYRGYDGTGHPLGGDTLYLDHHVWMLQNTALPADRAAKLLVSVHDQLVARSRCGAAIMHPPNPRSPILPPGWDINGGTWHALNSLLVWGLRKRDPGMAFDFLRRMSMFNRATQYPHTWYGIWSGPDAYNADDAERPGEAFYHASTPMCDFPFMNNNLHAGFIAAAARYAGIEAHHDRLCIDLSAVEPFTFRSRIVDITYTGNRIEVCCGSAFEEAVPLDISLPEGFGRAPQVDVEPAQARVTAPTGLIHVMPSPGAPIRRITISMR